MIFQKRTLPRTVNGFTVGSLYLITDKIVGMHCEIAQIEIKEFSPSGNYVLIEFYNGNWKTVWKELSVIKKVLLEKI